MNRFDFSPNTPPVARSFELRVEYTLAQISEMEETMQKKHRRTIILAAAIILTLTTAAFAASSSLITKLFDTDNQESTLTDKFENAVQFFAGSYESTNLRVIPGELLLTDDTLAATWTVENLTDELIWIGSPEACSLNGRTLHVLGNHPSLNSFEYYLEPGQSVECGVRASLSSNAIAIQDENQFQLGFNVYRSISGERLMTDENNVIHDENASDLSLLESVFLTAPVVCADVETVSALPEGESLMFEFADYNLIIDEAQLSPSLLKLKYRCVYTDSDKAPDEGFPSVDYSVTDLNGSEAWYGDVSGSYDLISAEDGTIYCEWEMEYSVTDWPESIILRPSYADDEARSEAESVILNFK